MSNDLLHFLPLSETVTIRGNKVKLAGVEFGDLGQLFYRFPELIEIGRMFQSGKFDPAKFQAAKPAIVAMVVAAAGHGGDEAFEKSFANLSSGELTDLFKSVFRLTSPGGIGPFVELLLAVQGQVAAGEVEAAPKKERKGVKIRMRP